MMIRRSGDDRMEGLAFHVAVRAWDIFHNRDPSPDEIQSIDPHTFANKILFQMGDMFST